MKFKMNKKLILIVLLLVISLGYAILSSNIQINGSSLLANNRWDIHFDNLNVTEGSVLIDSNDNTQSAATIDPNDNTKIDFNVAFSFPGDFYEFTVDVVNTGTVDGMVNLVTSNFKIGDGEWQEALSSNLPNYLKYRITYLDGDNIARYHELKVGETETYKVRVEFNKDIEPEDLPDTLQEISFNITGDYTQTDDNAKDREDNPQFNSSINGNQLVNRTISYDINYDNCIRTFSNEFNTEELELYCTGRTIEGRSLENDINNTFSGKYPKSLNQYILDNNVIENVKLENQQYDINYTRCIEMINDRYPNITTSIIDTSAIKILCHRGYVYDTDLEQNQNLDNYILRDGAEWFIEQGIISNYSRESETPGVVIIEYNDDYASDLIIPDTIDGAKVIGIGENVFNNKHIKSVVLPDSLEYIGDNAFKNNLITKVTIPKKVKEVGANAFQNNNLENVKIVSNDTKVNICAFGIKNDITVNNIPDSYSCNFVDEEVIGNEYTITFDKNNENATGTMDSQSVIADMDTHLAKNNYSLNGYVFLEWNTKRDGTGIGYKDEASIRTNRDMTLYARWKEKEETCTLTLNANGGEIVIDNRGISLYQTEITKGKTIEEALINILGIWYPDNHDLFFNGWYTGIENGELVDEKYVINEDTTLYARWIDRNETNSYTVTFDKNAEDAVGTMENQVVNFNRLNENNYSRDGYIFIGWNTESDGSGTSYYDEEFIVLTNDITLYAQWSKYYTITFDKNANDAIGTMESQSILGLVGDTLYENEYSREGYEFVGWNTESDGSGTSYLEEDYVIITGDITLYAQWSKYYTISFDKNNDEAIGNDYFVTTLAGVYTKIPTEAFRAYTTDDYYIKRWNTEEDKSGISYYENQNIIVTEDTTLYAEWEEIKVTPRIYWAIQSNDYNNSLDTLVISSYEVYGEQYGNFDGNKKFYDTNKVPWVNIKIEENRNIGFNSTITSYVTNIEIKGMVAPRSTAYWFSYVGYNSYSLNADLRGLNTKYVTDMSYMFYKTGYNATTWDIGDISNWDTSKVTDMSYMFDSAGENSTTWNIGDLSEWNTSKVTDMSNMFSWTGMYATTWNIGNLDNWNTSNVTDMSNMFNEAGRNVTTWTIGDISDWNTSNVRNMRGMFEYTGKNATTWSIGDIGEWDTSKVTDMSWMFDYAGYNVTTFNLDLSNWETQNVTDMDSMFYGAGYSATTWSIGDLSEWDTSKVTSMKSMFYYAGYSATTWSIGDLSDWDTSKVEDMKEMFNGAGLNATTWSIGDLSNWNISKVKDTSWMFNGAGYNATTWYIGDISNWNTSAVTDMSNMFENIGHSATTWSIGDLSNWDTSNVTDMDSMFNGAGYSATTWSIGDLSSWDTSKVTGMFRMFSDAGYNATTWTIGDISNWDTSKVTSMSDMFYRAGGNATTFNLNLSNWNTSNVTSMSSMFDYAGRNATTWNITIPKDNKNGTNNTTSRMYGKTSSTYAYPPSDRQFTLAS